MATNKGDGVRKGAVKSRTQILNRVTGNYIKRDAETGKFIAVKQDGKPFKGVRREKAGVITNPSISKETARKAEQAIIHYNQKRLTKSK